jgi:hypothetical protein
MKQVNEDFQKAEILAKEGKKQQALKQVEKYQNRYLINRINALEEI